MESSLADIINKKDIKCDLEKMEADMIVTIGGDGTILRTQGIAKNIPIFGINMGTIGFLTEIDHQNAFEALEKVISGKYFYWGEKQIGSLWKKLPPALNEVVVITSKPAKMLHFEVLVDDEVVENLRADGMIVSTPSGSTAYSMSAGGPIVDPNVDAFIIVPICPFKLSARPLVVPDNSKIKIKLLKKGKDAIVVVDGQAEDKITYMEELTLKKYKSPAYFVRLKKGFYRRIREKLTEGGIAFL